MNSVRIDKWLWAARFFKTRSLAKQAIDSGKVKCDGQRVKPSKELTVGLLLTIRVGWDEREVEVLALSDTRRGAAEAQKLYIETERSVNARETRSAERRAMHSVEQLPPRRPTKKQRRQIHRFREKNYESDL